MSIEKKNDELEFGEVEESKMPAMNDSVLWYLPPLLQEIARKGGRFIIDAEGKIQLDGFYKNGNLTLVPNKDGTLTATDKRNRVTSVSNFEDLVRLNFDWWKASTTKQSYVPPARPWIDHFVDKKWVTRQVIFVPNDDVDG